MNAVSEGDRVVSSAATGLSPKLSRVWPGPMQDRRGSRMESTSRMSRQECQEEDPNNTWEVDQNAEQGSQVAHIVTPNVWAFELNEVPVEEIPLQSNVRNTKEWGSSLNIGTTLQAGENCLSISTVGARNEMVLQTDLHRLPHEAHQPISPCYPHIVSFPFHHSPPAIPYTHSRPTYYPIIPHSPSTLSSAASATSSPHPMSSILPTSHTISPSAHQLMLQPISHFIAPILIPCRQPINQSHHTIHPPALHPMQPMQRTSFLSNPHHPPSHRLSSSTHAILIVLTWKSG